MNRRYDSDIDLQDMHSSSEADREISLGTSTILGIFFALALVCAVFFGFGYTMGRRSAQPTISTTEPVNSTSSSSSKPTPDSIAPTASAPSSDTTADTATQDDAPNTPPVTSNDLPEKPTSEPASQPVIVSRAVAPPTISAPTASAAVSIVQVAAVSHKEDADVLLAALKKRGYNVAVHQEQDKLLHVQLGPFATKKDADAMRQRLLTDGYNSIVK